MQGSQEAGLLSVGSRFGLPYRDRCWAGVLGQWRCWVVGGVRRLVDQVGGEHVVFGSHAPLFYFESAALKLRESELAGFQLEAIRSGNARRLLSQ